MRWTNATDLTNWKPDKKSIEWCKELMRVLKHNGTLAHSTGETYHINHETKTLTLIAGEPTYFHPRNKIAFAIIGYTVLP